MKRISVILLLSLFLSACVTPVGRQARQAECPDTEEARISIQTPSDFNEAISKLEVQAAGKGLNAAQACLDLSFLYSHHSNPVPDYAKAQSSLECYVELSKTVEPPEHVQNRLDLLRNTNDLLLAKSKDTEFIELMRQDNRTLMLEIQQLKNDIQTLEDENLAMKQLMERLNQLEIQHEQKRKQIK